MRHVYYLWELGNFKTPFQPRARGGKRDPSHNTEEKKKRRFETAKSWSNMNV